MEKILLSKTENKKEYYIELNPIKDKQKGDAWDYIYSTLEQMAKEEKIKFALFTGILYGDYDSYPPCYNQMVVFGTIKSKNGKPLISMSCPIREVEQMQMRLTAYNKTHKELLTATHKNTLNKLSGMTLVQIKAFAKRMGLKDYSSLKKNDLINLIKKENLIK